MSVDTQGTATALYNDYVGKFNGLGLTTNIQIFWRNLKKLEIFREFCGSCVKNIKRYFVSFGEITSKCLESEDYT